MRIRRGSVVVVRCAAVLAVSAAMYRLVVKPELAAMVMLSVQGRYQRADKLDPRFGAAVARENLDALRGVASVERLDPSWYLLYGTNCELLGLWGDAVNSYSRALLIDDRPEIYFNRGIAMLNLGRTDDAVNDLAVATRFDRTTLDQLEGHLRARVSDAAGPE